MRRNRREFALYLVCLALILASCGNSAAPPDYGRTDMSYTQRVAGPVGQPVSGDGTGLVFSLGEGTAQTGGEPPLPPAPAVPMDAAGVKSVLDRLPPLQGLPGDQSSFKLPTASLPAPRPGQTITQTFPPPTSLAVVQPAAAGPVQVLRHAPDGPVPLAPFLSATFNQPMVALTGVEDLAAASVPVQLEPKVPGRWRWVGTQTLLFEPSDAAGQRTPESAGSTAPARFPMATYFTATVPAGTTSANGGKLAEAVRWTFNTPPPKLQTGYPSNGPQRLDPVLFASFDQGINQDAVLKSIEVKAGLKTFGLRLATADEIKADQTVARLASYAPEGRWLAFRATEPFPADSDVNVTLRAGLPSAEGPRRTESAQNFNFHTYGPLRVVEHRCGWGDQCQPLMPWYIRFTNPLDAAAFDSAWVNIMPELPGAAVDVQGDSLMIRGLTRGRTTYQVTVMSAIKDVFGQTLGSDQTVRFDVGAAQSVLVPTGRPMTVLDPSAKPAYSVYSINVPRLKVRVQAVTPEDWDAYVQYLQLAYQPDRRPPLPGRQISAQTINVQARPDELAETKLDLAPFLKDGLGQLIVAVDPDPAPPPDRGPQTVQSWVQATRLGLDAFVDGDQMVGWANSLADGSPVSGVALSFLPGPGTEPATTGTNGLATLPLQVANGAKLLVARKDSDLALLPESEYGGESSWRQRAAQDELRWYVFDDRQMYRPGEDVHVKGWLRRVGAGKNGDVGPLGAPGGQVTYTLTDPRGNKIANGSAKLNILSGFDFVLTIPKETNVGQVSLQLIADIPAKLAGAEYNHTFQVQEFRRPEFEVKASAGDGPYLVGGYAVATVQANYYAGGGLPNADVTWRVRTSPGSFNPPNWSDFSFGIWQPWWHSVISPIAMMEKPGVPNGPGGAVQTFTGRTDASGAHNLRIDFNSVNPPQPTNVTAEATVMDVNRQAWTSSAEMLVHPADLYVGLRSPRIFVQQEEPLLVDAIVVDLDGKPVPGIKVEMKAARMDWRYKNNTWQEVEAAVQPCTMTSDRQPVRCTFETPQGGTYKITATITDAKGRPNMSEITRWVAGGSQPPARDVEQEQVNLIPDRKDYQPGDSAEILVQAPFYPAEGVVSLRRSGLLSTERFTMTGPTYTLKVPIAEGYIPNVNVQVDLVGAAPRLTDAGQADPKLPKRPAYATGNLNLPVPPIRRALTVTATPKDKAVEPGGKTVVDLLVKDAAGKPVSGAELAVVVVDEAVLSLTGYRLPDPLDVFYTQRDPATQDWHSRRQIVLANPADLANGARTANGVVEKQALSLAEAPAAAAQPMAPAPMATPAPAAAGMADRGAPAPPIAVRTDFNALATFAPAVPTDAEGKAQVEVKLPDNLTRYRVMAVAVAGGKQSGLGESAVTARLPLMVRPSAPRFLNFGDRFELPVVLQNQTDVTMTVSVAARSANAYLIGQAAQRGNAGGYTVSVPANDRVEVRFPATTDNAGTARFQFGAAAGQAADAAEISLPVYTPATTEAFATYGVIDSGSIAQPVIAPSNVYTQFGGLEISTSSTALQALTDAVLYLTSYPYECSEQLASRILAIASLRDVLTAFQASGLPSAEAMQQSVTRDITRLRSMQNPDGGWPLWKRGDESWPYVTVYVAHALEQAKAKGFDVPDEMLQQAQPYLKDIENRMPAWYSVRARRSITAYSLYVRSLMGDRDLAKARELTNQGLADVSKQGAGISSEGLGWLLSVMTGDPGSERQLAAIRQYLNNHVTETAGAANFVTSYGDDNYLLMASDRRADAVILDALMADQPKSDLIPKVVTGLLAHRVAGRWNNTQENTFVLVALDRYFNTYEAQTPDFVARAWLGDQYVGDHTFSGRTTERSQVSVPMSYVAQAGAGPQNVVLSKDGQGRMYYRLGMSYAPTDLNLKPLDAGFTVERAYEAVDNPGDVRQDKDGTWHIKAGARVRVLLSMVAPSRRYHVALADPLPAGLEPLNPALATTGSLPDGSGAPIPFTGGVAGPVSAPMAAAPAWSWWRWWTWYDHQNLRDDRAEAFTSLLWDGVYNYSYFARATTPGTFVVPPAKAEEMYSPETFGRTGTARVVVE